MDTQSTNAQPKPTSLSEKGKVTDSIQSQTALLLFNSCVARIRQKWIKISPAPLCQAKLLTFSQFSVLQNWEHNVKIYKG